MNKVKRSEAFILHLKLMLLFKYWRLFSFLLQMWKITWITSKEGFRTSKLECYKDQRIGASSTQQWNQDEKGEMANKLWKTTHQGFLEVRQEIYWAIVWMNPWNSYKTSTHSKIFLYLKYYISYYIVLYSDQKMDLGKQCENVKNEIPSLLF